MKRSFVVLLLCVLALSDPEAQTNEGKTSYDSSLSARYVGATSGRTVAAVHLHPPVAPRGRLNITSVQLVEVCGRPLMGGTTWRPVTDGQIKSSSVGAVAVSESNPDVVDLGHG